jgi:hypothetical protein
MLTLRPPFTPRKISGTHFCYGKFNFEHFFNTPTNRILIVNLSNLYEGRFKVAKTDTQHYINILL